jgi:hypothetical protein
MSKFNLSGTYPFAGPHPRGPAGAFSQPKTATTTKTRVGLGGSKKGYRGTLAGLGRPRTSAPTPAAHPRGPGGARFQSVQLPNRQRFGGSTPAGPKPSLMTRIASKARRAAAAVGF